MKNAKTERDPGSIAGRLTLLYTLSASALLIVVTAFLYEAVVINLREEDKQFLADKVHTLQILLKEHGNNRTSLEQEVQWEAVTAKLTPYYAYFSRILGPQGMVVIETPGMAEVVPATVFPMPAAETKQDITRAAQRITASQLHERINPTRWPRELKTIAEAFDQMLGRLEDSFTRLTQFSADLAHELRTPINNLMGEAEVTLARARSEAEYRDVLESSLEECGRLSRMIDSLLFLARADNAEVSLQLARLDVRQELEAIRDFYEAVTEEQGVTAQCEGEASLEADPILFRRALTNVLTNAIRHTPSGGQIKLVVEPSPSADGVAIHVSDNGCGIAREHLPKVFDRFYRVDQARSADSHSTGLGLAIVRSIMAMHDGTVSIESQPGKGTTVILHFPLTLHFPLFNDQKNHL